MMNLFLKKNIKDLFKKYNVQLSKRLGQNFLIDKGAVKKIIGAADLQPKEIVLEIGPGIGTLTQELAKKAKKVIAIEKDPKMIETLKETLKDFKNVEIIYGDVLKIENLKLKIENSFKIVANLPYYIASPIIRKFLENKQSDATRRISRPTSMVLMVQKEVAQRICAKPGKMSLLAVSVQLYSQAKIISYVSKKSFWPQPKVDSAIIKITPKKIQESNPCNFFKIVKAGFSQPRKQLINNLSKKLNIDKLKIKEWLLKNKIQPTQRAETLSIESWLKLFKNYKF